jgi:hypothetical protein
VPLLILLAAAVVQAGASRAGAAILELPISGGAAGADTFVRHGTYGDDNYGSNGSLLVKDGSTNYHRKAYFRFDTLGIDNAAVQDAELQLSVSTNNGVGDWTVNVFGLNDGDAGEGWIEGNGGSDDNPPGEITWNNAPANNTGSGNGVIGSRTTDLGDMPVAQSAGAGTRVGYGSAALAQFLRDDTDNQATLILTRNNTDGNTGSQNLGFYSKEFTAGDLTDEPALLVRLSDPDVLTVGFADPGFEATSTLYGDGTSDGPWEYARMAWSAGNAADFVFGVTASATFTDPALPGGSHTTSGNPGNFFTMEDTVGGGDSRGMAFVGQRLTVPGGGAITDVDIDFDYQRFAEQSTRATRVGLALFTASDWEDRQPGQPLLNADAGTGALWEIQVASAATNSDDLTWVSGGLPLVEVPALIDVLDQHRGEELVFAVYSTDYWAPNTQTFTYVDNFNTVISYVPEPGTLGLLALGAACLGGWVRRRRRRAAAV